MRFIIVFIIAFIIPSFIEASEVFQEDFDINKTLISVIFIIISCLSILFLFLAFDLSSTLKNKNFSYVFSDKKIKQDFLVLRSRVINFEEHLLYFFKTLSIDCSKNNNCIVANLDFFCLNQRVELDLESLDIRYKSKEEQSERIEVRHVETDIKLIINTLNILIDIFNKNLENSIIGLNIKALTLQEGVANFYISVSLLEGADFQFASYLRQGKVTNSDLNKSLNECNKNILLLGGSELEHEDMRHTYSFYLNLPVAEQSTRLQLARKLDPSLNVIICEPRLAIYELIENSLAQIGLNELSNYPLDIALRHIKDPIYRPDAVFISAGLLLEFDASTRSDLIKLKDEKGFCLFAICGNEAQLEELKNNYDLEYVCLPYTKESFDLLVQTALL